MGGGKQGAATYPHNYTHTLTSTHSKENKVLKVMHIEY